MNYIPAFSSTYFDLSDFEIISETVDYRKDGIYPRLDYNNRINLIIKPKNHFPCITNIVDLQLGKLKILSDIPILTITFMISIQYLDEIKKSSKETYTFEFYHTHEETQQLLHTQAREVAPHNSVHTLFSSPTIRNIETNDEVFCTGRSKNVYRYTPTLSEINIYYYLTNEVTLHES